MSNFQFDVSITHKWRASEGDLLNLAVFGITAKKWRELNTEVKGNMCDFATTEQLFLESMNARLITLVFGQTERLKELNSIAIDQIEILLHNPSVKKLKG